MSNSDKSAGEPGKARCSGSESSLEAARLRAGLKLLGAVIHDSMMLRDILAGDLPADDEGLTRLIHVSSRMAAVIGFQAEHAQAQLSGGAASSAHFWLRTGVGDAAMAAPAPASPPRRVSLVTEGSSTAAAPALNLVREEALEDAQPDRRLRRVSILAESYATMLDDLRGCQVDRNEALAVLNMIREQADGDAPLQYEGER